MTPPASQPPAAVASAAAPVPKPPDVVVVSRDTRSDILASVDTPLPLIKAGRTEDAMRQAVFLTSALTVVRPAAGAPGEETLRWSLTPYLQRQLCFTSITGQFACAAAETEELAGKAEGEAPFVEPPQRAPVAPDPLAETARNNASAALRGRADGLFDDDRRLKLDPMIKAAGVSVRRVPISGSPVRR